jgi:hypothetical protein
MTTFLKKTLKNGVFIALSLISLTVFGQEKPPVVDWDKAPTAAELDLKIWEKDTLAEAVVLDHTGWIRSELLHDYYGFIFTEKKRTKILKKSGFDRANLRIRIYTKNNANRFNFVKARTWLPSGRKVEVESKSIVYEQIDKNNTVAKVVFPQVTEGAILEYEWSMESQNNFSLRPWDFQSDIPVRRSVLNLDIFSRYEYVFLTQAERIKTTKPNYTSDARTEITFFALNQPALREENFISTMDDYRTSIRFQLGKYYDTQGIKHEVLSNWEKTARDLNDNEDFGKRYTRQFSDVVKAIIPTLTTVDTGLTRVQKIYDFVNAKIIQEGYSDIYALNSINELYKKGKASPSEINLMLVALLREAGFDAYPVLISTRDNGRMHENYPIIEQFNQCLVQVEFADKRTLLLDGGNKLRPLGILRESALNSRGCVIKEKSAEWIHVRPPTSSLTTSVTFKFEEDGTLKGGVQTMMKGYIAVRERDKLETDREGKYIEKEWAKDNPDVKMDSVKVVNADNPNEALRISYNCVLPNAVQITNDLLYIKPTFHSGWENSPFASPERHFPVDMPYPLQDQFVLNLVVPKGYKIEELPKSVNMVLPNGGGSFMYQVNDKMEGQLQINFRIKVQKTFYTGEEYPALKKFFDDIAAKLQEMVVLKKMAG